MSPTPTVFVNLAVLSALSIPDSKARDAILINLGVGRIQERKRSVASILGVVCRQELLEPLASSKIVLKSDVRGQVRARVKGTGSLSVIQAGCECVLEHPVGAGFWSVEAASHAIAGAVNAVLEVQVYLSDDTSDVDAGEVAHTAAVI